MAVNGSTGPRTEKGKAMSSRNATKHGLNSVDHVARDENPVDYEDLVWSLKQRYQPQDKMERLLLQRIIDAAWRLGRVVRTETRTLNHNLDQVEKRDEQLKGHPWHVSGHHSCRAFMLMDTRVLGRYESRIERSLFKNIDLLEKVQKARLRVEQEGGSEREQN